MKYNFSAVKFVIPSYKRAGKVKTLKLLENNNIPLKQIFIFVVDEEYEEYKKHYPEYKIIIGKKGIVEQRQFINDYFKENAKIVSMDDDLNGFKKYENIDGEQIFKDGSIKEFIGKGFRECLKVDSYIFGIYPSDNYKRDMHNSITYNLCFIIGHFYGYINRKDEDLKNNIINSGSKDDYIRSLTYFLKDKVLVRFNNYCCLTNTYNNKGGLNIDINKRIEENNLLVDLLLKQYPEYISINNCRKPTEFNEILFKTGDISKSKYQVIKVLKELNQDDEIVKNVVEELEKTDFKINHKRKNSGVGKSFTLGRQRIRTKKGTFINKLNVVYPILYEKILKFAEENIITPFNAIQVNKDYATKPHTDTGNKTISSIVGLGNYKGGLLKVNNIQYDIRNKIIQFDGKKYLHSNKLSSNEYSRYSLVFFTL